MLKQAASAAASNSSGLLPVTPSSKREVNDTLAFCSAPLSVEAVPVPLWRSPDQVPLACRRMSDISRLLSLITSRLPYVAVGERHDEPHRRAGGGSDRGILGLWGGFVKSERRSICSVRKTGPLKMEDLERRQCSRSPTSKDSYQIRLKG